MIPGIESDVWARFVAARVAYEAEKTWPLWHRYHEIRAWCDPALWSNKQIDQWRDLFGETPASGVM